MNSHPSHNDAFRNDAFKSYVEHLSRLARERPSDRALIVVNAQGETTLDYATLERRSRALASELQQRFAVGERALILLDNDEHYVVAFFACLYSGVIAVPVFPPESAKQQHLARLLAIAADSQAVCVLTSTTIIDVVASASEGFGSAELIPLDAVDESRAEHWVEHHPKRDDLAFLQYTSGSTATPKGVMVSHGNLMANERAIETGFSIGADDVFVSWLPLYHDMGLIGGLLQPIYRGIPAVLMSPTFFLQWPIRWLEAISRYGGTISGGPDFAYRLCLERIRDEQIETLDLSSWRVAFSGAEPVRHATLTGFIERFRPAGFAADTAAPCYGLAEATLLVSCNPRGTGVVGTAFSQQLLAQGQASSTAEGNTLVGCGTPQPDHAIDIVDPEGLQSLPEGDVGEIWVNGPSVAHGYWHNPEATAKTFVTRDGVSWQRTGAHDSDAHDTNAQGHDAQDDRWLRTGDLGFLHQGQLYIAGRIKDLIILRGNNVYPQDIESAIEAEVEAVRKGRVAAFAVTTPEGAEGIGVAAEVSRGMQKLVPAEKLIEALREAVGSACHEPLSVALLLNPGGLPKTSSGKLQRSACRQGWEAGSLDAYAIHAFGHFVSGGDDEDAGSGESSQSTAETRSETEQTIATLWRQVLGDNKETPLGSNAHFFASGGNSLAAVQLASRISDHWGIDFSAKSVFEHASLGAMANEVERISSDHANSGRSPIPRLSPTQRAEPLPLSHDQQRLWFLWQLEPESTAYHIGGVLRLSGQLDTAAMRDAFDGLVARHESLRTLFHVDKGGAPKQLIRPDASFGLEIVDFRGMPAEEAQQREDDTIRRINDEPFDLSTGPLLRAALLRVSDDAYALVVVMHHIISDGVSIQIMLDELVDFYRAHMRREPAQLPELRVQYADYASWQRDCLAAGEGARQLAYWQQQLGSEHPVLDLPTDHPRQASTAKRAGQHEFSLPEELQEALCRLAESQSTSLFSVLLAGFQGLLHRYSGQREIRVGVPMANRQRQEVEGVIGFFVNTLVLRNDIDSRHSLETILMQCQDAVLGALTYPDLPFEQLVEALQPERSLNHNPLFQVMFNYRQEDQRALQTLPDLTLTDLRLLQQDAQCDLMLEAREFPDKQLKFSMVYASELFEPDTIERLAGHFQAVLKALVALPAQAIGDIKLLPEIEQQQLARWSVTSQSYSDRGPVHRQVEARVEECPDALALVFGSQQLTYAELNTRANRLAHRLLDLGVTPEMRVGIAVERSIEMVVGLLGILKAGGVYVPLDPHYPKERVAYLLEDSGIELLLTQQPLVAALPIEDHMTVVELDQQDCREQPDTNPDIPLHGDNLVYVLYTSGSTGKPKGITMRHQAISELIAWHQVHLPGAYRTLMFASPCFDVGFQEVMTTLSTGGCLVQTASEDRYDFSRLIDVILRQKVERVFLPYAVLKAFVEAARTASIRLPQLTQLITAGEQLKVTDTLKGWLTQEPQCALINQYGPTETHVVSSHQVDSGAGELPPIGKTAAGAKLLVLNEELTPVPIGVNGELFVGEVALARGYLHRPGMTAERFVADPFDTRGGRLYRTGDLVRWRSDGQLEYLGRLDHQVKVRGFRVELGEIEAQLQSHHAVKEAVVVALEAPGGARLVAHVVPQADVEFDTSSLREALEQKLPDYMVPGAMVTLEALPLTPNGKVDRKALPEPDLASSLQYEPPQGELEEALAEIWSELLGVERVGRHDNFFELGGHSLLSVSLLERMRAQGWSVSVRALFQNPVFSAFVRSVVNDQRQSVVTVPPNRIPEGCQSLEPDMVTLMNIDEEQLRHIEMMVPGGASNIQDIYPLGPLQEGMFFHHLLESQGDAYLFHCLLQFDTKDRLQSFIDSLNHIIFRHDILRSAVVWEGLKEPVQVVYRSAELSLQWLEETPLSDGMSVAERLNSQVNFSHYRLDVRQAPMMRAIGAADPQNQRWLLSLPIHHLVLDHATLERIAEEIALMQQGRADALPEPVPYRRYVAQARLGVSQAEHEAFFKEMLGDVDEPTAPFGLLDARGDGTTIEEARMPLDTTLALRLRSQARRHGVSAATLFHVAWALVLARTTGKEDVVFGTVLYGRMQSGQGAERALGLFINTLPIRIHMGVRNVEECLHQTHSVLTELLHHEHASLALAQGASAMQGGMPIFSALLNYRHSPRGDDQSSRIWDGHIGEGMEVIESTERTNYPIGLSVDDHGEDFELLVQIAGSFGAQRLCEYVQRSLHALVDALDGIGSRHVCEMEVMAEHEQQQLACWSGQTQRYPYVEPIHHLIEHRVEITPDATAVVFEDQSLSYAELNTRANCLAHYLIGLGVKPETRVGIAVERSIEMVVGLLAVLKAGGAYVPLDPDYPAERLAYMVEDSGIELLLTQQHLREELPTTEGLSVIELDRLEVAHHASNNPEVALHGEHLAYVIYTSGSTGRPKGAANRHHALINRLQWMQDAYGLTTNDAVLQKTPFSFDVSVWEFFWPLMQGARLVMAPPGSHREPAQLVELIRTHGITTLHFVPSMLQAFLAHGEVETCTSLTRLVCSGEALPAELQNQVLARLPHTGLYNLYGPTEAAIDVTHWTCQDDGRSQVAIGQPISGIRTYVLDRDLNLAPPGVAGELYLGGVGLARGYLHRPDLTAERFVADPFAQGECLYRTGDLVRWREDGQLEYLGRLDHQVKIRGLRIELGEIEAELLSQPEIREAVVVAQEGPGGSRLVAYVVPQDDREPDTSSLREMLGQRLPDYMVPGVVVTLEALPLNANGKVDRKALPAPDLASSTQYEPPQGEVEEALAAIWSDVLGVEQVGRNDNFFELGGHSLLALKVLEQMRHQGLTAQVRMLFQCPELAAFAQALTQTSERQEIIIPPNSIPDGCSAIQPEMLSLIELNVEEIRAIEAAVPGGASNIQDIYPLAPLQEGILFHHRLQEEGDAYVTPRLLGFDSRERLEAFIAGFNQLIARHDILRTAVLWENLREPVQVVYRHAALVLERLNVDGASSKSVAEQLKVEVDPEHHRLDVRRAPMLRALAVYDAEHGRWLLQLPSHHLVMDHTTLELLVEEIALIQQGREDELPKPIPFRNFVAQARLGVSLEEHEAFFRERLGDVEEPTAPFGLLDVHGDSSDIEEVHVPLAEELAQQVRQQAQRHGISTASLFHLAWALVLSKTTGHDDVVFGTVLFGRMQGIEGAERALGMFINTLPVRIKLGAQGADKSLRQTHDALSELMHHEHASLGLAQRCSGLPGGTPLFTSLLNYRYSAPQQEGNPIHTWEGMEVLGGQERTNYPITMSVDDLGNGFELVGQVSRIIGAKRLCDYLSSAIAGIVENLQAAPQQPLSEINLLRAGEQQLLNEWGENTQQYSNTSLIHHLIEGQAAATPEVTALVFEEQSLSYAELNARANRLAYYLVGVGVRPETRVGIAVERSIEMVVGLLGILKAGGAYVPLDPDYPSDRLAYMVEDSGIELLLTQQHIRDILPVTESLSVIELDQLDVTHHASTNPEVALHGEHLAYVIYTSGSTGRPKGAANRHHALTNRLQWMQDAYGLTTGDAVLQKTPFSFDVSVWEFFWPLMQGARLVMAPPGVHHEPAQLVELIRTHGITTLHFVPSMLQAFLAHGAVETCTSLTRMVCSGEALPSELQSQVFARLPYTGLYNLYGPTEAAIDVTHWTCQDDGRNQIAIGQPIAGIRTYVLDGDLNLAPLGVAGELYLGGIGLARGYLHRPDLTAERFIADPFAQGERLYRTGDLVRWRKDGQLEYLGRLDHQVKIRGLRIELGEIEAELLSLSEVREAVVLAQEGHGGSRLVAYVVPQVGSELDTAVLREALGQKLPDYMVPGIVVTLDALPLNANGKVDRKALPAPDLTSGSQYEPPQGEVEEGLVEIWSEVLGVERVGRHDNFFEVGGHSLSAIQISARFTQRFGEALPVRLIFEYPTLAHMATQVAFKQANTDGGRAKRLSTMDQLLNELEG
ncbi:amino acid adenylation domain-containing protein [Halomonas venusta]|uniref:non-ribosomal peptide synthetase n=1 Tax=Vreelandella venusta TaxID=44935 RepID=UPI00295E7716|nr:non-ribosomal peptide synthetase [Halomonas venusta]MDW0358490.1 amino acid adenylation domain-containing protein [Halomonas venusta]